MRKKRYKRKIEKVLLHADVGSIKDLVSKLTLILEEHGDIRYDCGYDSGYYDSIEPYLRVSIYEEETDEAYDARIARELAQQEAHERKEFKRLQKIYGKVL